MRVLGLCVLALFAQLCAGSSYNLGRTILDSPINVKILRTVRQWTNIIFGTGVEGSRLLKDATDSNKVQKRVPDYVPFPCDVSIGKSKTVPTSVHRLRPGDIDVIASIGDSLSAGAGVFATNVIHVAVENRGVTGLGGGQGTWRQYLTVPNILREFNPSLIGYARGDALTSDEASELNVAETGAVSSDTPYMTQVLIRRIKNHPKINVNKHWKLVSFMIGSNDFCTNICYAPTPWVILEDHKKDLLRVLRTLRDNLPRTFVNLVVAPNIKALVDSKTGRNSQCDFTRHFECSCLFGLKYRSQRQLYYEVIQRWQQLDIEIANYPEFQREDFTVVAQPIIVNTTIPKTPDGYADLSFFSADCFHISQKMNARYANAAWNALLSPMEEKYGDWEEPFKKFLCPTPQQPYLTTSINSPRSQPYAGKR